MPQPITSVGPNRESKPVSVLQRPLIAILEGVDNENEIRELVNGEKFKKISTELQTNLEDELGYIPFVDKLMPFIAPVMNFLLKSNPIELAGYAGVSSGVSFFVLSLLKPLLKWGGITLGLAGAGAAVAGKFLGISWKDKSESSSGGASSSGSTRRDEEEAGVLLEN